MSHVDAAVEPATHVQIGSQVGCNVLMRCRQQKPRAGPSRQPPDVERNHLRQQPVERRREFVRHQPGRLLRQSESQPEPVSLSVGKFTRRAKHQVRFGQAAGGEQSHRVGDRAGQRLDKNRLRHCQVIEDNHARPLVAGIAARITTTDLFDDG
ncbi:MAG: hypothetical protein ACF8PG_08820, partial [Maioricimonas sp. JB045]